MSRWSRHRLRTGDDFRAVTRGGVRSARSHVVVHLALLPEGPEAPRVGFVVSKKIGNAVVRNRTTRRLREIIRPLLPTLPAYSAVVVRALPGIDTAPYTELARGLENALESASHKLQRRIEQTLPAAELAPQQTEPVPQQTEPALQQGAR